jgi:hypothetical protein
MRDPSPSWFALAGTALAWAAVAGSAACNALYGVDDLVVVDDDDDGGAVHPSQTPDPTQPGDDALLPSLMPTNGSASSGGATEDPTCGPASDCTACGASSCALGRCQELVDGCFDDPQCAALNDCYHGCASTDQACFEACTFKHLPGARRLHQAGSCVYCAADTCASACGDGCPVAEPPACDACVWDKISLCQGEHTACVNDASCFALTVCIYLCKDAACVQGCANKHPAGVAPYNALGVCLVCQQATCYDACGGAQQCPP